MTASYPPIESGKWCFWRILLALSMLEGMTTLRIFYSSFSFSSSFSVQNIYSSSLRWYGCVGQVVDLKVDATFSRAPTLRESYVMAFSRDLFLKQSPLTPRISLCNHHSRSNTGQLSFVGGSKSSPTSTIVRAPFCALSDGLSASFESDEELDTELAAELEGLVLARNPARVEKVASHLDLLWKISSKVKNCIPSYPEYHALSHASPPS